MKAVLTSIQPKWCALIASGKKTTEVRKTKPKLEMPFKVYIYCTKPKRKCDNLASTFWGYDVGCEHYAENSNGKVIGEFVCNRITEYECSSDGFGELATTCGTCLTYDDIINYCNGNELYGWHISNLVIYDKPKELSEFSHTQEYINKIRMSVSHWEYGIDDECARPLRKPPQSWCYVEEKI